MASLTAAAPADLRDASGALDFFRAQQSGFLAILAADRGGARLVDRIWMQAFTSFERNVEDQTREVPVLACRRGCGTCRRIPVAATAPEVLMATRDVRAMAPGFRNIEIDLVARILAAPGEGGFGGKPQAFLQPGNRVRPGIAGVG